jgi:hypothetical protein
LQWTADYFPGKAWSGPSGWKGCCWSLSSIIFCLNGVVFDGWEGYFICSFELGLVLPFLLREFNVNASSYGAALYLRWGSNAISELLNQINLFVKCLSWYP